MKKGLLILVVSLLPVILFSQGITTSAISGKVVDQNGNAMPGVNVVAVHEPSGSRYGTVSRDDGNYNVANVRPGGPYSVKVSMVGYSEQSRSGINADLGQDVKLNFTLREGAVEIGEVVVTGEQSTILNATRTGAATAITRKSMESLPTITRRISDFTRLTPQFSGNNSFSGMDNRYNNTTVDGSYFNNSFGLQGQPGDRTGVAPISIEAIEQVQVNIAPFDVRQGNFVGAGINSVTKSGTNNLTGSAYYLFRHQGLVGTKADTNVVNPGTFKYNQVGFSLGGPIIEDKLFFFSSFEQDKIIQPGTTFRANKGGETVGGSVTRVLESDLITLSTYLKNNFNYETGAYQGFDFETPATRFLGKLDYNLDESNKFTLRAVLLNSVTDVLTSNSSSLGAGSRANNTTSMNFQNSNYQIMENITSVVGEWNSIISNEMSNNLIVGYSYHDESRKSRGTFFPMVDILQAKGGTTYISFGFEPFTPSNELRYSSIQFQDNFNYYMGDHSLSFGLSVEKYESENIFFPGSQSVYVFNSLTDFYNEANKYKANPNRTAADSSHRFQVRYANIPGMEKPVQPLKVLYSGVYAQDEFQYSNDIKLTLGLRVDLPMFDESGEENAEAAAYSFKDENGETVKYSTKKMPDATPLLSPRLGLNWDLFGDRSTQLRGGSGVFTGKPAYVWISNQIGNNGILTGFEDLTGKTRPFNPDPNKYKPSTVTGAPAASYELALTDPDFKFPQVWRNNFAIDQKLLDNLIVTAEFLYNKDVNGVYYINANLDAPNSKYVGVDTRNRWTSQDTSRIINKISSAIVMKNQNVGFNYGYSFAVEKSFSDGWFAKAAYNYGVAKNTVDPGSIAFGSWANNPQSGDPNNPGVGYSANTPGHRFFATGSYSLDYLDIGSTTVSIFFEGYTQGNASYTYSGDLNGDRSSGNDLIYIPNNTTEMNFTDIKSGTTVLFTAAQQATAWEAYINQDDYLKANRGKYAERGAVFLPMVYRADASLIQDVYTELFGKKNNLQFRVDIMNFTNLLDAKWGVGWRMPATQVLAAQTAGSDGKAVYQLARVGGKLIDHTFEKTAGINDVFRIQLGVKYSFN